jgi:hypothetical protein
VLDSAIILHYTSVAQAGARQGSPKRYGFVSLQETRTAATLSSSYVEFTTELSADVAKSDAYSDPDCVSTESFNTIILVEHLRQCHGCGPLIAWPRTDLNSHIWECP